MTAPAASLAISGAPSRARRPYSGTLIAADALDVLKALPGNAFEALLGNRIGQYNIRINMQWRICFTWNEGAENVQIGLSLVE